MSWSSSTTPISSGETNSDVEDVVADRQRADQPIHAELLGQQAADLLVHRAGLDVACDRGQEQVLGVDAGDLLLGDVAGADQGHLGQGSPGLAFASDLLDLVELFGLEPAPPRQQLEDQGRAGIVGDCDHRLAPG